MQGWSCESHLWTIFISQSDIVKVIAFSSLPNVLFHTATHWTGTATKSGDSGKSGDNIEPGDSCESGDNEKAGDSETAGDTGDFYFLDGSGNSEESGDFGESDVSGEWTVPRRRAERKDRPACRVPFLSDRPSNPHKEMQKKVLCGLFFPFVFLRGAVRKVSRLLSWAWVEGNLRRMGYRTGLCCFSPVLPYIYLWWPEKCMTTPHFEEGSGN